MVTESLSFNDSVVCPHCGYKDRDSWEIGGGEEGGFDHECASCGELMRVERHVSVTYSTRKPGEAPW